MRFGEYPGLKGVILHDLGAQSYEDRVARLQSGKEFDKLGAWLMQADPVTEWVAAQIEAILTTLNS